MGRLVHFEIPADDPEKVAKFYENVFEWKFSKWAGPVDYWLVTTGDDGTPGINGGLVKRSPGMDRVVNTVDVASVDDSLAKIVASGGKVHAPKMGIPGVGWLAYCADPDGNIFGIMQVDPAAR